MRGWQKRLAERGILGINRRNVEYIMRWNRRALYPLVDDKLRTKQLALEAGLAVPPLYGVIETHHDVRRLPEIVGAHETFVIKPAHGSQGDGILVVAGRRNDRFRLIGGQVLVAEELYHHLSNTLSGQYSLGGARDRVLVEYKVEFDPLFEAVSFQGVPDIRVIVFRGYPVMAMVRLPTRHSGGKANLHQGAIGVGIDIASGVTLDGVAGNEVIVEHPDTGNPIAGIAIPGWERFLELAARCHDLIGLGYLGVDMVLDRDLGPLILELNARPGLSIQLANGSGLDARLRLLQGLDEPDADIGGRIRFARQHFGATG